MNYVSIYHGLTWFLIINFTLGNLLDNSSESILQNVTYKLFSRNKNGDFKREISQKELFTLQNKEHLKVQIFGQLKNWTLLLHASKNLVTSKFENTHQTQICHFSGVINGSDDSRVALNLCRNISGIIQDGAKSWELTSEEGGTELRLMKSLDHKKSIKNKCGVPDKHVNLHVSAGMKRSKRHVEVVKKSEDDGFHGNNTFKHANSVPWRRYIEVWFTVDKSLFEYLGRDKREVYDACYQIVNIANTIFEPLLISLVIIDIEIWDAKDLIRVTSDYTALLDNFQNHRKNLMNTRKHHDYTILLTNVDFLGQVVGYAYVAQMCSNDNAVAVVEVQKKSSYVVTAGTVAHEVAHGLGAMHDDLFCHSDNGDAGVMHSSSSNRHKWSNCTNEYIAKYIDSFHCLRNVPEFPKSHAFCGNGKVDPGEQCDCGGFSRSCENCCHSHNCTLRHKATCATYDCCDLKTCSPKATGIMCRPASGECDLPEYCSGSSETCPTDIHVMDGTSCGISKSYCVNGLCGGKDLACKVLVNPAAVAANEQEIKSFGRTTDVCRNIFCKAQLTTEDKTNVNMGLIFQWSNGIIQISNETSLYIPQLNGMLCGKNQICINDQCTEIPKVSSLFCKKNCSGHGICNSNQNCHCHHGFAPPECMHLGHGGSIDSGHSTDPYGGKDYYMIYIQMLLIGLPFILLLCFLWPIIHDQWEKSWKGIMEPTIPRVTKFVDSCCCTCMSFFTKGIQHLLQKQEEKEMKDAVRRFSQSRRPTICDVGMTLIPKDPEWKSWGVADSMLATDVITITPKSTPDTKRKIRLPSDSPILRSKSDEELHKPSFNQTISTDSGCISDVDSIEGSFSPSMTSLITRFTNFGKNRPKTPPPIHKIRQPEKDNLRRMVVDPMSSHKLSRQVSEQTTLNTRINLRRSVSEDPTSNRKYNYSPVSVTDDSKEVTIKNKFKPFIPPPPRPTRPVPPPPPSLPNSSGSPKTSPKDDSKSHDPVRPARNKVKDLTAKFQ